MQQNILLISNHLRKLADENRFGRISVVSFSTSVDLGNPTQGKRERVRSRTRFSRQISAKKRMSEYLASTDKRGAQGAGVPELGRFGTALSLKEARAGVTGESATAEPRPCSLRTRALLFFVPQENMTITQ